VYEVCQASFKTDIDDNCMANKTWADEKWASIVPASVTTLLALLAVVQVWLNNSKDAHDAMTKRLASLRATLVGLPSDEKHLKGAHRDTFDQCKRDHDATVKDFNDLRFCRCSCSVTTP